MNLQEWAQRHRLSGHHPNHAPTRENPERWDCDCGAVWRILTADQVRRKYVHLTKAAAAQEKKKRRVDRATVRTDDDLLDHLDGLLTNWEDARDLPYGALPTVARGFAAQLRDAIHE